MTGVTQILASIKQGDPHAAEQLLPLVYDELRRLAAQKMAQESPGQTLQATALVHEAYLRLVDVEKAQHWNGRGHFFGAAAEAMRRILVEQARRRQSLKAGGACHCIELSAVEPQIDQSQVNVVELSEALDILAAKDPRKAQLVKLRFFAGLSHREAADALGISTATADDDWAYAKSWLCVQLAGTGQGRS